jgi:HEAT repeat protein
MTVVPFGRLTPVDPAPTPLGAGEAERLRADLAHHRDMVVARAVDGLRRLGDEGARRRVLRLAEHPSPHVRASALRYLAEIEPDEARPLLVAALEHPHFGVREDALRGLERVGDPRLAPRVLPLLDDGHPDVRRAAERALRGLDAPGHPTAADAALADHPAGRVLRALGSGGRAVALVDPGDGGRPRQVLCRRGPRGWIRGPGAPGPGWLATGDGLGVLTLWGRLPRVARRVVVAWDGREHKVPLQNGYFLFAAWDVPEPAAGDGPEIRRLVL